MVKQKPLTNAEITLLRSAIQQQAAYDNAAKRQCEVSDCQGERVASPSSINNAVKSPSPLEMVDDAAGRVGSIAARLNDLAGRLVGELPCGADVNDKPARSGQLGGIADRADNIFYAVNAMHAAIDRIEQQLP